MEKERKGREGRGGERRRGEEGIGEGAGSAPKLKLGPQNYFPGAGAEVLLQSCVSLKLKLKVHRF